MTIFVDVDDTLVLYDPPRSGPHPYGVYDGIPWKPNERLIEGLKAAAKAGDKVIVWSGGGGRYAGWWVQQLELGDYVQECWTKTDTALRILVKLEDVVIDDQPVIGRTHEPDQWPG